MFTMYVQEFIQESVEVREDIRSPRTGDIVGIGK